MTTTMQPVQHTSAATRALDDALPALQARIRDTRDEATTDAEALTNTRLRAALHPAAPRAADRAQLIAAYVERRVAVQGASDQLDNLTAAVDAESDVLREMGRLTIRASRARMDAVTAAGRATTLTHALTHYADTWLEALLAGQAAAAFIGDVENGSKDIREYAALHATTAYRAIRDAITIPQNLRMDSVGAATIAAARAAREVLHALAPIAPAGYDAIL